MNKIILIIYLYNFKFFIYTGEIKLIICPLVTSLNHYFDHINNRNAFHNYGCFTMEKKKAIANSNVVERVKGTHSFVVGDETLNVKVKIINVSRVGLRVDVDGPVKVAMNYSEYVLQKMKEKMKRERG